MIRLIAAIDRKRGMAKNGGLPWSIPEDEKFFTDQTKLYGGDNLIGLTTFKTFSGPLKGRRNYVLTHDKTPIEGAEAVHDLKKFLESYKDRDLWVVGGANVFGQVIDLGFADELYLTHIEADFGCHQFFPEYESNFALTKQSELREQNGFIFTYATYAKIP